MPINYNLWKLPFEKNFFPNWPCPSCNGGILKPFGKSFEYKSSAYSYQQRGDEWDFLVEEYRYSVLLECSNENCKEHVSSCGRGYISAMSILDEDGNPDMGLFDYFEPLYFYPPVHIFPILPKCPESVAEEIKLSFQLFFADPPASANHARKCVENILTERKIGRFHTVKGKRERIPLHQRITKYQDKNPSVAEKLLAIKWLGNEGSHGDSLEKKDVLDLYDILETVIDDLYIGHRKAVDKKVALVNKRGKPVRKKVSASAKLRRSNE